MAVMITQFRACDGSIWNNQADAEAREILTQQVNKAMLPLGQIPEIPGCGFQNGDGYLQHTEDAVKAAKLAIHAIAKDGPLKWWIDGQITMHGKTHEDIALRCHPSCQGRMLDGGCAPLERAYGRLCCIDAQNREWGQQYYCNNPDQAKQVKLN